MGARVIENPNINYMHLDWMLWMQKSKPSILAGQLFHNHLSKQRVYEEHVS